MLSDYAFFKCVDDSVDALSQYSDNPVYYYFYTHHGQHSLAKMQNVPLDVDYGNAPNFLKLNLKVESCLL